MSHLSTMSTCCTGGIINVCNAGEPSSTCALYLRSMTLYNLGAVDPNLSFGDSAEQALVTALGNYTSMMWSFAYPRSAT